MVTNNKKRKWVKQGEVPTKTIKRVLYPSKLNKYFSDSEMIDWAITVLGMSFSGVSKETLLKHFWHLKQNILKKNKIGSCFAVHDSSIAKGVPVMGVSLDSGKFWINQYYPLFPPNFPTGSSWAEIENYAMVWHKSLWDYE